ncbi:coiled-coil domain-containing protein 25-like [Pistacia vera]|uniref:coiled-coil domain-containing protein 25-like n=1 Tax=Pistacia vera TaxID=55513 RepID=UPI001262F0E5|nr:coiled-coil domain-containing protein 25-like [Pistacia vera]
MVFYFKARPEAGDYTIFMGLDKYENEELIKYGFPEDVWFHVDKMSSAHVYLRLHKGQTIDDISEGVLEDCAQLVKANSIQGNKVNNIDVVYTPWSNLKKTASMDVGQVGFHNSKMVRTVRVEKRINEVVNRLNKTKVERKPDLKGTSADEGADYKPLLGGSSTDPQKFTKNPEVGLVTVLENIRWKELGLLTFVWVAYLALQIAKVILFLSAGYYENGLFN